MFELYN